MSTTLNSGLAPQPGLRLRVVVLAVLALCVAAAYVQLLGAGWVYDDVNLVQPSPALKDLAGLGRALSTDLYRQAAPRLEASPYWRPLAMFSFWLDTRFGSAPLTLHIGNIVLHALSAVLLALVVMRRHGGTAGVVAAALAAAWWALHPGNVEAVAWISCRYDLLCGVALLCFLAVPWRQGPLRAALHGLVFLAGLLAKESFGVLAVVVVALDFADQRPARTAVLRWVAVALALVIWMALRAAIGIRGFDLPPTTAIPAVIGTYLEAVAIYLWRAVGLVPLTVSHPYVLNGLGVLTGLVLLAILTAAGILWRRLAVPVTIFLAGLIPMAGAIAMFHEAPERYFYIPSIGLALLVGQLVAFALARRQSAGLRSQSEQPAGLNSQDDRQTTAAAGFLRFVVPAVVGIAIIAGFVRLEQRLPDWQSDDLLWASALRTNPLDPQANLNQAIAAGRRGNWAEAERAIAVAEQGDPNSGRIAGTHAWVLLRTGDFSAAAQAAERATTLAPYQPDGWYYLAFARHKIRDHAGELAAVEKILEIAPDYPGAREMREIAACEVSGRADCLAGR